MDGAVGCALRHRGAASPHPRQDEPRTTGMREDLPPGYRLEADPDVLLLLRPDGSLVAAFSVQGADPKEVFAAAWEDYE